MARLSLFLLGSFRATLDGEPVTGFVSNKVRALLAYLAVEHAHSHSRSTLAGLLWPGWPEASALASLRTALANLRTVIRDRGANEVREPFLLITRETIQFNADSDQWIDVLAFGDLAQADMPSDQLEKAIALYRGPFMEGFAMVDSAAYDDWISLARERLQRQMLAALQRLIEQHEEQGALERACEIAWRWVELAPWQERAHQALMRLLALSGQRGAALAQYEACRRTLREELDVEPGEETLRLWERIRSGALARSHVDPGTVSEEGSQPPLSAPPAHNLPAELTPFVSRKALLSEIVAQLEDPDCRLLTLVGPGGSGKTRLARQAARAFLSRGAGTPFEDGLFFVPLAPLRSSEGIVPTIASAIGFSFYEGGTPKQQLLDYLRHKQALIILDNVEHLLAPLGAASLVLEILHAASGIKILVTSRIRLNVQGEHLVPIGGMHYPERMPEIASELDQYSAVQLFVASARETRPGFEPTADEMEHVIRICQLVEGMPLALLLAAAWMELLTPAEIAGDLSSERSLDFLAADWRETPERQRSMRAVFDYSWSLLEKRERAVFCALSVFRGGFTRQAAEQVAGASLRDLMGLASKSLLHRTPASLSADGMGGRYELHELLRQYAAEKLAGDQAVHDRHSACYTTALQAWATDLQGPRHQVTLSEIETEYENARAAWGWAAEHGQVQRLDQALEGLAQFYRLRCRYDEGEAAMSEAARHLQAAAPGAGPSLAAPSAGRVLASILTWQSTFCAELGQTELAGRLISQSEALLEKPEVAAQEIRREKAFVLMRMGVRAYDTSYAAARDLLAQSLALYRELGDQARAAEALFFLGGVAYYAGDPDAAHFYQESLEIRRALGNPVGVAEALTALGNTSARQQPEKAERLRRESLAFCRETGDRFAIARGLHHLGAALLYSGKYREAYSSFVETARLYGDLGARRDITAVDTGLGFAQVHWGEYDRARTQISRGLHLAREIGNPRMIGVALVALGHVQLAMGAPEEAERLLQEAVTLYRELEQREYLEWALACLGHAELALGKRALAREHLSTALRIDDALLSVRLLATVFSAIALLFADQGQPVRAVELYALASRYPYAANSRWFEDVVGKQIAAAAAALPPDLVAAAEERGCARDLEATVEELLAEL